MRPRADRPGRRRRVRARSRRRRYLSSERSDDPSGSVDGLGLGRFGDETVEQRHRPRRARRGVPRRPTGPGSSRSSRTPRHPTISNARPVTSQSPLPSHTTNGDTFAGSMASKPASGLAIISGNASLGHATAGRRGDGVGEHAVASELGGRVERERGDAGLGGRRSSPARCEPRRPAPDDVVTIRASRGLPGLAAASRQYPIAWRTGQNSPRRCTRITASHSSTDMFTIMRSRTMPALHTTVSRPPNVVDRLRDQPAGAVPVADVVAVDDRFAAGGLDLVRRPPLAGDSSVASP